MLERVFKLRQHGTCVKTELLAGLTTFLTMAYIVALNPNLLTNFGAEGAALWNGVFLATCIASAVGTFCVIDMFDTIGTLVGTATRASMVDRNGRMPNMKGALLSDAIGTITGACTGTSTVSTFIESAAGVEVGGRTGLTAAVTALMFLLCMFLAPVAAIIPPAATSAALIYVGILMLQGLKEIDFGDMDQMVPVGLMLIAMPVSGSIGHAIGIGLISYTVMKVFKGKAREVSVLTYAISVLFLVKFFVVV